MTFKIRRAKPDDAEVIARFNQNMAIETEDKSLDWEKILPGVQTMLQNEEMGFYLVAEDESGQVLGCLGITYEWSDWRNGLFWWIQSVYVDVSHRARGVFSDMYAEVKRQAQSADNVCGIRLYVEVDNENAMRTYFRLGMTETPYRLLEEEF